MGRRLISNDIRSKPRFIANDAKLQETTFSMCKLRSAVLINWQDCTMQHNGKEAELQNVPTTAHSYPHYNMAWGLERDFSIFFLFPRP